MGEVVVKAKKWSREKDIYENRSKSVAYYDVPSEMDDIWIREVISVKISTSYLSV